jgi:hemoglobin/transferrin/lactoferrin receptor protein
MMNKSPITLAMSSLIGSALLTPAVIADDHSNVTVFDKVTVSAERIAQTAQRESRSIDTVSRTQLDEMQPRSVAEALRFEPNVSIVGGPIAGNQSVNIRGLEGNKILQIIDGTRVNTVFTKRPSYFLDPALIKDINVVKGPVSSLWGSGAVGGAVTQQTITAADLVDDGETFGGLVKLGFSDNGDQLTTTGAIGGATGALEWLLAASFLDSDDMKQGNGDTLYGSETENSTVLAKVNLALNATNSLGFNYREGITDGFPPAIGLSGDELNQADQLIKRKSTDKNISLIYQYNPSSMLINADARVYQNITLIDEVNVNNGADISRIETDGFAITNQSVMGGLNILTGIDGYNDALDAQRPDAGSGRPLPPADAKSSIYGGFIYADYALTDSLLVEAGLRYDGFSSSAQGFEDNDESALSPSAALSWQVQDWARLSLRYDSAFRAPDVYELYLDGTHFSLFPGGPTNIFVPNPELEPETANNIELKGEFVFTNIFTEDNLTIVASIFDNKVEDFIQLSVTTVPPPFIPPSCFIPGRGAGCFGTSESDNIANATIKGFELTAAYELENIIASLSYGQTRGEDDDSGEALTNIPADKLTLSVDYKAWVIDTKFGFRAIYASDQDDTPTNDDLGPYDGYTTVDLYASWEPSSAALEGVKVDLTLANAFDEDYRTAWAAVSEAGRSVRLSAQYSF